MDTPASSAVVTIEPSEARMGSFMDGADGERLSWRKYNVNQWGYGGLATAGWGFGSYGGQGAVVSREGALASFVASDLRLSNPTLKTIVEVAKVHVIGTGLNFSSKIDPVATSMTPEQARDLAKEIDRRWRLWAASPIEADISGRFSLHQIAATALDSFMTTGEVVAVMDWQAAPGARTRTKVALLDATQLDRSKSGVTNTGAISMGVELTKTGRVVAYHLRRWVPGQMQAPVPQRVAAFMPWGRPKVIHLFDPIAANQVRGASPLTGSLTAAHERATLQEFTLAAAVIGTSFAMTLESSLPASAALSGLDPVGDAPSGYNLAELNDYRTKWFTKTTVDPRPGVINVLPSGDKLVMNRAQAPADNYEEFQASLTREAARAAGAMVEDISGDFSRTSFSASRLATETPYRTTLRTRAVAIIPLYQAAFRCWLEEEIEMGRLPLPKDAVPFQSAPEAYCGGKWLGPGRIVADPKKQAEGDLLEVENNLSTLSDKLAERGQDLEDTLAQRKYENDLLRSYGLTLPGAVTTRISEVDTLDGDDPAERPIDEPAPAKEPPSPKRKRR